MAWAALIPIVTSLISAYASKKGGDKQNAANSRSFYATERARGESLARLQAQNINQISQQLFPGLFAPTTVKGREGRPFASGLRAGQVKPGRAPRLLAQGGPLAGGESAIVGEEGPELFVPEVDGEIVPNQGTAPSGAAGPDQGLQALAEALMPYILEVFSTLFPGEDDSAPMAGMEGMGGMGPMDPMAGGQVPMPRAAGGPVQSNRTYAVGGRGPETFIPTQPALPAAGQPRDNRLSTPNVQPFQPTVGSPIGGMVTQHLQDKLANPGQLATETYERGQEQSNIGLNAAIQGILGGLTGAGVDPNSPMGQALVGASAATAGNQRNELARDFSLAKEALGRQDVEQGTTDYLRMLETILGLARSQAAAAGGQGFPATNSVNTYTPFTDYFSVLGDRLGKYLNQSKQGGLPAGVTEGQDPFGNPTSEGPGGTRP